MGVARQLMPVRETQSPSCLYVSWMCVQGPLIPPNRRLFFFLFFFFFLFLFLFFLLLLWPQLAEEVVRDEMGFDEILLKVDHCNSAARALYRYTHTHARAHKHTHTHTHSLNHSRVSVFLLVCLCACVCV